MEAYFRDLSSDTQLIRSGLAAVEAPIVDIKNQLSSTHEAVNDSTQLLVSQYGAISYQARETNQVFLGKFQETANIVQRLEELCSKQHQETMKTIERLAAQTQHNYRPNHAPVALVRQLAGKPALLKEAGNAIQTFEQAQDQAMALDLPANPLWNKTRIVDSVKTPQLQSILGRICICPRQRSVRDRKWIQLGGSSFFGDWETQTHWDACPLSKTSSKKRRVAVGFNYAGLSHILKTAIKISFALTYGAGGFSISQSFACTPTVDDKLDPAFRILDLIGQGLTYTNCIGSSSQADLMLACRKRLIRLFDDGKICAKAVNESNQSLMHQAILCVSRLTVTLMIMRLIGLQLSRAELCPCHAELRPCHDHSVLINLSIELLQTLLSYGVAPFTFDKRGQLLYIKRNCE